MADVLALVGSAIDRVKRLKAITDKIRDAESRNLIGDLSISLADLRLEIADLKNENLRLQTELKQKKVSESEGRKLQAEQTDRRPCVACVFGLVSFWTRNKILDPFD